MYRVYQVRRLFQRELLLFGPRRAPDPQEEFGLACSETVLEYRHFKLALRCVVSLA